MTRRRNNSQRKSNSSLSFEALEPRRVLTTLLVNFIGVGNQALVNTASAGDFAVADPNVDLSAPVNVVVGSNGDNNELAGTNGLTFGVTDSGGFSFNTPTGIYDEEPILDSYLFINDATRTITVNSLEEIAAGQSVTVTLFGVGDQNNQESEFTVSYAGDVIGNAETNYGGSFLDTFRAFSFTKQAGVDQFEVAFQNAGNGGASGALNGFSVTTSSVVRINAGGESHVDSEGNLFLADQFFSTPSRTFSTGADIFIPGTGGTTANDQDVDDILYQTERFGTDFNYEIPVTNGFYSIRLRYAEIFHDDIGERVFDVSAEGNLISDNLDIFEARQNAFTPGNFSALIQEFPLVEVTDGALSLNFNSEGAGGVDNAKISAIEVIPVDSAQLVVSSSNGDTTVLENGFSDTYTLSLTVAPTSDVTVFLNTGTEVTADVTSLVFTPDNFDIPQTVTLTAINDSEEEGTQTVSIPHTLASLDPLYDGIPAASLSVIVRDDDLVEVDFDFRTLADGIENPLTADFGPDGRLYVATQNGQIRAYTIDSNNNVTDTQIINTIRDQSGFNNVLGIAFNPFEQVAPGETPTIYATRSSLFDGTEEFGSRVSTLTGPNFTTVTDIVTGLPVSGFDHGINGIQFDGNGDLLIAVGGNTNTGSFDGVFGSQAPESPLTSAILLARITEPTFNGNIQYEFIDPTDPEIPVFAAGPNDQRNGNFVQVVDVPGEIEVETFAVGLRNPYDLVYTTDGRIFATDNGPNGIAEDELNLVSEGDFLGHPSIPRGALDPRQTLDNAEYDPNVPSDEDYTAPLAELSSSTNGIDEYRSEAFGGQLRGQLFAQRFNNQVFFFERTADGLGIENINQSTDVGDGLDILAGPGGTIISIDRNQDRITIAEPNDPTVVDSKAYDIFPFRAPAVGGNQFILGGVNFGSLENTTVTIAGVEAELISVDDNRIVGIFPGVATSDDLQDVVVDSDGNTSILSEAFLPLGEGVDDPFLLGDVNLDGNFDFLDISPFITLLSNSTFQVEADINLDGTVDFLDISPFIALLASGSASSNLADGNSGVAASPSRSLVAPEAIVASPSSSTDSPDSISQLVSDAPTETPITAATSDAEHDDAEAPAATASQNLKATSESQEPLTLVSDSTVTPVVESSQPVVVDTAVAGATPIDIFSGPVAFASDRYRFLGARNRSLIGVESNRPLVTRRSLVGNAERIDLPRESSDTRRWTSVSPAGSFSTAAELFDAHPESLDDVFDFEPEETLAGPIK